MDIIYLSDGQLIHIMTSSDFVYIMGRVHPHHDKEIMILTMCSM